MNTKGNQRTVMTDKKIKKVFLDLLKEKEPEKISVSEICSRAGIHRTTFYAHYQDVNDLMRKMVGEMYGQVMGFFLEEGEPLKEDGFLHLFELIRAHRDFFRVYLEISKNSGLGYDFLPEALRIRVDQMVSVMGWDSPEELYYHQAFFCEGLSAVIRRWIALGCKEEPEKMCSIIEKEYAPRRRGIFMQ